MSEGQGPYRIVEYGGVRPFSVEGPGIPTGHGPVGITTRGAAEVMAHDFAECYRAGAESMRERAAKVADEEPVMADAVNAIRALPLVEPS